MFTLFSGSLRRASRALKVRQYIAQVRQIIAFCLRVLFTWVRGRLARMVERAEP